VRDEHQQEHQREPVDQRRADVREPVQRHRQRETGQQQGPAGQQRPGQDRADQRAQPAHREEQAGADRAHPVDAGEQREDGQHAVAEPDRRLDRHQRQHRRPVADVAQPLPDRRERPLRRHTRLPRRLQRPADPPRRDRGQRQRDGGDPEAGVRVEGGADDPAERGSDHRHRPPGRAGDRVRGRQLLGGYHVGHRGGGGRRVERLGHRHRADRDQGQPRGGRRPHAEQQQDRAERDQVRHDHDLLAVEPVGDRAGVRQRQRHDAGVDGQGQRAPDAAAGQLGEQDQQRHHHEPVRAEDDQLGGEQVAEVGVAGNDREGRRHVRRR
jgi:hypothetical protein